MRIQRWGTVGVSLLVAGLLSLPLLAQSGLSTRSGVYSADQAQQGEDLYSKQCVSCHGTKLEGSGQNPPLTGPDFLGNWTGQTLADLYTKIQATMPATNPGSLTPKQASDLVAYLLKANQLPAGTTALPEDPAALKSIRMEAPAAQP